MRNLIVGVLLLVVESMTTGTQGFSVSPVVVRSARGSSCPSAISVPLDDWSTGTPTGVTSTARDRIQRVLERAKRRTGRENRNTRRAIDIDNTPTTTATTSTTLLPFTLPSLTTSQRLALEEEDEIVIAQSEMGRKGSGFVVQDISADEGTVWTALLDFEGYERHIHTVRSARVGSSSQAVAKYGQPSVTRASFEVSKFRVPIHAVLNYYGSDLHNYMELSLDDAVQNSALQSAKGYWYTQPLSATKTRVWLLCDLTLSPLLPQLVVDIAAASAMPRASHWLRPTVSQLLLHQKQ